MTLYIDLPGVGGVKNNVSCDFTKSSFDLTISGLEGKNYRLFKDNLDKDIIPESCKFVVKKDKIVVKLAKVKGEYSYESWTNLTSKKSKEAQESSKKDPMGGIMVPPSHSIFLHYLFSLIASSLFLSYNTSHDMNVGYDERYV